MSSPGGPSESESVDGGVIAPEARGRSVDFGRDKFVLDELGVLSVFDEVRRARGTGGRALGVEVPVGGTGFRARPAGFDCGDVALRFGSGCA